MIKPIIVIRCETISQLPKYTQRDFNKENKFNLQLKISITYRIEQWTVIEDECDSQEFLQVFSCK